LLNWSGDKTLIKTGLSMAQPLPISRIMYSGLLLQCSPQTSIADAAARMSENSVSSILIADQDQVIGIWTEHDALALDFTDPDRFNQPVSTVMSSASDTSWSSMKMKHPLASCPRPTWRSTRGWNPT
jgi:predicted transcriptional regulator